MPRKIPDDLIRYASEQIAAGRYLKDVAAEIGYFPDTVAKRVKELTGIVPCNKSRPTMLLEISDKEVVALYQSGMAEKAIAEKFGCSRPAIRRRLLQAGVHIRGGKEAASLWLSQTTKEFRQALTEAAHASTRGRKKTLEYRQRVSDGRQRIKYDKIIGPGEIEFVSRLKKEGIAFVHQKSVDGYNIDFAIGTVAVELTMGTTKYAGIFASQRKRIEYLLNRGYTFIFFTFKNMAAFRVSLDDVIAHIKEVCALPPERRQNWVVRCGFKDSTVIRSKTGQFTRKPMPITFFYEAEPVEFSVTG